MNESRLSLWLYANFSLIDIFIYCKFVYHQLCYLQWHALFLRSAHCGTVHGIRGVRNHENGKSKFDVIHDFILAYLATNCPKGCINHPCKRVFKSYTLQCILRSLLCSVSKTPCASPKHDVGLNLWPVSLKIVERYLNLTEDVSNNFKYLYLIYWAIMFFVCFLFCHSWVVMDFVETSEARLHFPSISNHDKN